MLKKEIYKGFEIININTHPSITSWIAKDIKTGKQFGCSFKKKQLIKAIDNERS